ncbi:hypothetical protein PENTCL1PPCAC_30567, partial [Pristionchus entomophagus]
DWFIPLFSFGLRMRIPRRIECIFSTLILLVGLSQYGDTTACDPSLIKMNADSVGRTTSSAQYTYSAKKLSCKGKEIRHNESSD